MPKQRNSREENEQIKANNPPVENWSEAKKHQKDVDAKRVKKNNKNYYGYNNHIQVDVRSKFVRDYAATDASVHDSNVFEEILDENNTSKAIYADSAYPSEKRKKRLEEEKYRCNFQRKGYKKSH